MVSLGNYKMLRPCNRNQPSHVTVLVVFLQLDQPLVNPLFTHVHKLTDRLYLIFIQDFVSYIYVCIYDDLHYKLYINEL